MNHHWMQMRTAATESITAFVSQILILAEQELRHQEPFKYNSIIVFLLYLRETRHLCLLSKWHLLPFPSLHRLPISAAGGCDTWLGRRASPGWLENRWPLDPRSKQGRSNVRAQRAQPQGSEVKRQGLSERAAGWSAPLGIAEDCTCVRVCYVWGGEKGGGGVEWGLCLDLVCSGTAGTEREKRREKNVWMLQDISILNHFKETQSATGRDGNWLSIY